MEVLTFLGVYALVALNVYAFLRMGLDKYRAGQGLWRVPEKNLLLLACLGGSYGILAGMRVFRHKTRHAVFVWLVPVLMLLDTLLLLLAWNRGYLA